MTASAIVHLSILALLLLSDVHPFRSVTAETIAVDIVTPQEVVPDKPEPAPASLQSPSPEISAFPQDAAQMPPAAPQPNAPGQQAALQQQAALPAVQQNQRADAAAPKATLGSSAPNYRAAEPDLSIKYNVMLGLPPELPVAASSAGEKAEDGYDASAASMTADVSSNVVAAFRRHLKSCSKLPASVTPSDNVLVKLRVFLRQDGRLAGDPAVGGGSANIKAIELLQSAIAALKTCQPYAMLPADRYGEWKTLDLTFTPKDFGS